MKTFFSVFLFLGIISILLLSCSRPSDSFDRTNNNDPESESYDAGTASNIDISFNDQGIITLNWADTAKFEDGYIIEKSLGNDSSFTTIGQVPQNRTTYHDSSRAVKAKTYYRVSAFKEREDGEKQFKAKPVRMDYLGSITAFNHNYSYENRSLKLEWFTDTPFDLRYRLEYRKKGETEFITFLETDDPSETSFTDPLEDVSFKDREYRLTLMLRGDNCEDVLDQQEITFLGDHFFPSDLSVVIEDEQTVALSWTDNSYFEKGYKVFRSITNPWSQGTYTLIDNLPANSTDYQDKIDLQRDKMHRYKILAYDAVSEADSVVGSQLHTMAAPSLINPQNRNTDPNEITISWQIQEGYPDLVSKWILQRRPVSGSTWTEIGPFEQGVTSYTDSDINMDQGYEYRIRTITSQYSEVLTLHYSPLFNLIANFDAHDYHTARVAFSPDGRYVASLTDHSSYNNSVKIWDIDSGSLYKTLSAENASFSDAKFNADGTLLAGTVETDEGQVKVFAFPSGNLTQTIDLTGFRPDVLQFSPDSKTIYITNSLRDITKINLDTETTELIYKEYSYGYYDSYLALSPDGKTIANNDNTPTIVSASDGSIIKKLTDKDYWHPASNIPAFSSDGSKLAILYNEELQIFDTSSWNRMLATRKWGKFNPQFDPTDSDIVIGFDRQKIHFRDISSNNSVNKITTPENIHSLDYSSDGKRIAVGLWYGGLQIWEESDQHTWKEVY